jgi:hypothetical protein
MYNNLDTKACTTASNQWPKTKYAQLKREWLLNPAIKACNSAARLEPSCVALGGSKELAEEFIYYKILTRMYHLVYGAPDCVVRYYVPYDTDFDHDDHDDSDFATMLAVTYALLALC